MHFENLFTYSKDPWSSFKHPKGFYLNNNEHNQNLSFLPLILTPPALDGGFASNQPRFYLTVCCGSWLLRYLEDRVQYLQQTRKVLLYTKATIAYVITQWHKASLWTLMHQLDVQNLLIYLTAPNPAWHQFNQLFRYVLTYQ